MAAGKREVARSHLPEMTPNKTWHCQFDSTGILQSNRIDLSKHTSTPSSQCHDISDLSLRRTARSCIGAPESEEPHSIPNVVYMRHRLVNFNEETRPRSTTHRLCHHTQSLHHLIVPFSATPVSLTIHNKAIFVLHVIIKDSARHLARHTDMLFMLHAKREESLAMSCDVRRLTQVVIEIVELFLCTIANTHVADRH